MIINNKINAAPQDEITQSNLFVDLFCGAGGLSTGAHLVGKKILACVNHDPIAIESHLANHPKTVHLTEDVRDMVVIPKLKSIINGRPFNLWASLECINFTCAKGGMKKDLSSRTLPMCLLKYVKELQPETLWIENVKQFRNWGPLDLNTMQEIKERRGEYYKNWLDHLSALGYEYDYRLLNGADFGSHQNRTRYFAQFRKRKNFKWPSPTHGESSKLLPYNTAKDILQLENIGESIFGRKKPYVEKTLKRIYEGLIKFKDEPIFLDEYYGNGRAQSVHKPIPVITTKDRYSVIHSIFIDQQYGNSSAASINQPINTITTNPKFSICYVLNPQYSSKGSSLNQPMPTIIARQDKAPLGLIHGISGPMIGINEKDSHYTKLIKEFMNKNGISDIRKRPLNITELKRAQGFNDDYILKGSQQDQKKFIGNAVDVTMAKALLKIA